MQKIKSRSILIVAAIGLSFLGLLSTILIIFTKVRAGYGLEYYFTGEGVETSYISALITVFIIILSIFIGWIMKIWSSWKEARLIERYAKKKKT